MPSPHWTLRKRLEPLDPLRLWPLPAQRALAGKIANANVAEIAQEGRFPDWLGLLGLALFQTEQAELSDRVLTAPWCSQLFDLLPPTARARSPLASILEDPKAILTWRNLEAVELGLLQSEPAVLGEQRL